MEQYQLEDPGNAESESVTATCRLCRSALDDAPFVRGPFEDWFHAGCLRRLLELPDTPQNCRHCSSLVGINININVIAINSCSKCGSAKPIRSVICQWCGIPLYQWQDCIRLMHLTCHIHWLDRSTHVQRAVLSVCRPAAGVPNLMGLTRFLCGETCSLPSFDAFHRCCSC